MMTVRQKKKEEEEKKLESHPKKGRFMRRNANEGERWDRSS
jgi:hypothetical protein